MDRRGFLGTVLALVPAALLASASAAPASAPAVNRCHLDYDHAGRRWLVFLLRKGDKEAFVFRSSSPNLVDATWTYWRTVAVDQHHVVSMDGRAIRI